MNVTSRAVLAPVLALALAAGVAEAQEKPPVTFVAANPTYFRRGRGGAPIRYVVIHTIEGSARSAINTFRNGDRRVSAHYIVDHDGSITQMVQDEDTAWHAGSYNRQGIGIEHAGYADRNTWTDAQYRASARLTRWVCDTYGVPIDREHIVGHVEVPGATHHDPGRYFDWELYLRLVREGDAPDVRVVSPAEGQVAGRTSAFPEGAEAASPPEAMDRTSRSEVLSPRGSARSARPRADDSLEAGLSGLLVEWATRGTQRGARVLLEEVGGGLRYDSGHLAGAEASHRVTERLLHGRTYRWRVRVWDGDDAVETPWTTFSTDFTPPRIAALSPVEGQVVEASPVLRWSHEDDAPQAGFRVEIDDDEDHASVLGDTRELNGAQPYYFLRGRLEADRTYFWRVTAFDGRGNSAVTEWARFRTSPSYAHTAAAGLTVRPLAPGADVPLAPAARHVLSWAYHSGQQRDQAGFRIQVERSGALVLDETYTSRARGYRARPLEPGRYRWRVQVSDGATAVWSPWATFRIESTTGITGHIGE